MKKTILLLLLISFLTMNLSVVEVNAINSESPKSLAQDFMVSFIIGDPIEDYLTSDYQEGSLHLLEIASLMIRSQEEDMSRGMTYFLVEDYAEWQETKLGEDLYLVVSSMEDYYEEKQRYGYIICKEEDNWKIALFFGTELIFHYDYFM